MVTLYPARVQAIRERDGIRNNPNFLPADTAIPANTHICKVYSAILDDIDRYDRLLAYPESRAIYRIVEEVYKKVLSKTLETVRGHNSNHEWVNNQEEELRVLKKRLDFHETRTKETKLSRATPIELLCRLVATISAKPEWSIERYEEEFKDLSISRFVRRTPTSRNHGLPAKLFIGLVPHGGTVHHVIVSSADHFQGIQGLGEWANSAHQARKREHQEQLSQLQKRVDRFYEESGPFRKDEVELWNFIHRWKILNTPQLQGMDGSITHTNFDVTAAAFDMANGLTVCPGCYKCRAVHTFKLSPKSINAEADFPGNLATKLAIEHPSCSCCEDLGSLLCLKLKSKAMEQSGGS